MKDKIEFLRKVFGKAQLQNNNIELMVPCPVCKKPKLKMNIRLDSDLYHCWVCNTKGRNLGRLIKMKKPDLVSVYFDRFNKGFKYSALETEFELDPVELPEGFRVIMDSLHDPSALAVRKYANTRGINDAMLWRIRAGYSDEWKWRRRLIVPSFDCDGNLNYFVSRDIGDSKYKYINAKANKRAIIFNNIDIDWSKNQVLLVEGPLDLVKCLNINSTCLLGSSLTEDSKLFQAIVQNSMDVILALDPDAYKKQLVIAKNLSEYDICVYFASPKIGDIGDMSPKQVEQLVSSRVKYENEFGSLPYLIDLM